ncbi:MAG: ester cyclase [Thermoplasmata archaeon]
MPERYDPAFPDLEVPIDDQIAEGVKGVTRETFRGTRRAEFSGHAPTGKRVEFDVNGISRVSEGVIVGRRAHLDVLAMVRKLDLRPPGSLTTGNRARCALCASRRRCDRLIRNAPCSPFANGPPTRRHHVYRPGGLDPTGAEG